MQYYLGRQAIYDQKQEIFGYELLHRSSLKNEYQHDDADDATVEVIISELFHFGAELALEGKIGFVNADHNMVMDRHLRVLPPKEHVIELSENIDMDDKILEACNKYKNQGYCFALDDVVAKDKRMNDEILKMVDYIKIDWLLTDTKDRPGIIQRAKSLNNSVRFVAEKIETEIQYQEAILLGCHYTQGYYHGQPDILTKDA